MVVEVLAGRPDLQTLEGSIITGEPYSTEVILPLVHLFQGTVGPRVMFMDDNARPHYTAGVDMLLESEDAVRIS